MTIKRVRCDLVLADSSIGKSERAEAVSAMRCQSRCWTVNDTVTQGASAANVPRDGHQSLTYDEASNRIIGWSTTRRAIRRKRKERTAVGSDLSMMRRIAWSKSPTTLGLRRLRPTHMERATAGSSQRTRRRLAPTTVGRAARS